MASRTRGKSFELFSSEKLPSYISLGAAGMDLVKGAEAPSRAPSCEQSLSLCASCVVLQLKIKGREGRNSAQREEANLRVIKRVR